MRTLTLAAILVAFAAPALAGPAEDAAAAGDWSKAADLYAAAVEKRPGDRAAALGLAQATREAGRDDLYGRAEAALRAVAKKHPKDVEVWVAIGDTCLASAPSRAGTMTVAQVFADAMDAFKKAAGIAPDDEAAAVGVARAHYAVGETDEALAALAAYLGRDTETQARTLYWQGEINYQRAVADYQQNGKLTDAGRQLFQKAAGALSASTRADPTDYDAWLRAAYAAQYLGDTTSAVEAYEQALALDPQQDAPIRGLKAIYGADPKAWGNKLATLAAAHPEHPWLNLWVGYAHLQAGDHAKARPHMEVVAKHAKHPADGHYYLGRCYAGEGKAKQAAAHFRKAVEANPAHALAIEALEKPIRDEALKEAASSVKAARKAVKAYDELLALAPGSYSSLNNLGFILREAYVAHQDAPDWQEVGRASRDAYVRASKIIGEYRPAYGDTLSWAERYARAQVVSDTGLMFQFYEPMRDYEKAEMYYIRALEFSQDGYYDAFTNLGMIYAEQERWQDLYDLAEACSEGIRNEDGSERADARASARGMMKKLKDDGKVDTND